jgi:hypothetical protein
MLRLKQLALIATTGCLIGFSWSQAANVSVNLAITRPAKPRLNYPFLTLKVNACGATSATVTADGQPVTSTLTGGNVVFTTSGSSIVVNLVGTTTSTGLGTFSKAVLKDDKKWAWSYGVDDNYDASIQSYVPLWSAHHYTATAYWNGIALSWNPSNIPAVVTGMWPVGNHSWSHDGNDGTALSDNAEVTHNDSAIVSALAGAGWPNFIVNTFANPDFDAKFNTIIPPLYNAGQTNIVLIETGQSPCKFILDSGATATSGGYAPLSIATLPLVIGRDFSDDAATIAANGIAATDYMHTNANATHHFWYNAGNDGPQTNAANGPGAVVSHVYTNYDAEAWVASSSEIFGYLITYRLATVAFTTAVARGYLPLERGSTIGAAKVFDLHGRALATLEQGVRSLNGAGTGKAAGVCLVRSTSENAAAAQKIIVR